MDSEKAQCKILKIEIEITKKAKKQGLNRPASITTCELKRLKLSHMDLYSDSINLAKNSVLHSE